MTAAAIKPGDPRWKSRLVEPRAGDSRWVVRLRRRCAASSISKVAAELGVRRDQLSDFLRGASRARAAAIELRFANLAVRMAPRARQAKPSRVCPHLGRRISFQLCSTLSSQAPESNWPATIAQLLACATCPKRVKEEAR